MFMSNLTLPDLPVYELYAIRYATRDAVRSEHFIGGDPHDGPMPMDYFIWLAKSENHIVVIDTGFTADMATKRNRQFIQCPIKTLDALGIQADAVDDVILTHLHYDHSGHFDRFPGAQFHLQEQELQYATGRYMRYPQLQHAFELDDVCGIVRLNYAQKVTFYDGDGEVSTGLRLHRTGGHSAGLQFVSVHTKRGWVVLASDASHYYEHMESYRPFTIAFHVGEMMESFDRLKKVAPSLDHIIPGHDPKVMKKYPALAGKDGLVVQLDENPV
jgi:glyoxylase-like metal-dependent hydrolase (beta-lactamase superfamily II)